MASDSEVLPNGAGFICGCGFTVLCNPDDTRPQIKARLCTACAMRRGLLVDVTRDVIARAQKGA